MSTSKTSIQTKIQLHNVLRHELETLKPGRKVYVQQPGSIVFFKDDKEHALQACQNTLKSLQQEYEQLQAKMDVDN